MTAPRKQSGFSLTEMLLATGIMAIGLVMIATIFPVGVKLTGMSVQRSIAAVAADEAFAKVRLYGVRDVQYWPTTEPNSTCTDFMYIANVDTNNDYVVNAADVLPNNADLFLYPSAVSTTEPRRHHWSALCRQATETAANALKVTVFVTHKTTGGMRYYGYDINGDKISDSSWPMPVAVNVQYNQANSRQLVLGVGSNFPLNQEWDAAMGTTGLVYSFFNDGYTIVNNKNGVRNRILEMRDTNNDGIRETMILASDWGAASSGTETIWVVPPGIGSSTYPCIGVSEYVIN